MGLSLGKLLKVWPNYGHSLKGDQCDHGSARKLISLPVVANCTGHRPQPREMVMKIDAARDKE